MVRCSYTTKWHSIRRLIGYWVENSQDYSEEINQPVVQEEPNQTVQIAGLCVSCGDKVVMAKHMHTFLHRQTFATKTKSCVITTTANQ